jgi:hypothetical protein
MNGIYISVSISKTKSWDSAVHAVARLQARKPRVFITPKHPEEL